MGSGFTGPCAGESLIKGPSAALRVFRVELGRSRQITVNGTRISGRMKEKVPQNLEFEEQ